MYIVFLCLCSMESDIWVGLSDDMVEASWMWEDGEYTDFTKFKVAVIE